MKLGVLPSEARTVRVFLGRSAGCRTAPVVTVAVAGTRFRWGPVTSRRERSYQRRVGAGGRTVRMSVAGGGSRCGVRARLADATRRYVPLGAAVGAPELLQDDPRGQLRVALARYDAMTFENEMKFDALEPEPGAFRFAQADAMLARAEREGKLVRGHTLIWSSQLPGWVRDGGYSRAQLIAVLERHVRTVVRRYRGRIETWDVVNEPVSDDVGALRTSIWRRVIGPEYIEIALRAAHAADPGARLSINEYADDLPGPKLDALLATAADLKARGVPLDSLGVQMHVDTSWPGGIDLLRGTLDRIGAIGLRSEITELEVGPKRDPAAADPDAFAAARQTTIFGQAAQACAGAPSCVSLTTWGVVDPAGVPLGSLPFRSDGRAKPAFAAITRALAVLRR